MSVLVESHSTSPLLNERPRYNPVPELNNIALALGYKKTNSVDRKHFYHKPPNHFLRVSWKGWHYHHRVHPNLDKSGFRPKELLNHLVRVYQK